MKHRFAHLLLTIGLLFPAVQPVLAAQDPVIVGATPNNDKGDPFRTAAIRLNRNDAELYAAIASIQAVLASLTAANPVTSVAGRRGAVTLSSTDLSDATSLGRSILSSTAGGQVLSAIGGAPLASPSFLGGLSSAGIAPLDMTYAGIINPNAVMLRPGNQVSICPALSCIYGPSNGTNVPAFYDHQRASLLLSAQTQDDAHSEEQTLAVTTTINTGLLKTYAASTAYVVGDNVMVGNAVYRATQAGTTGANSAPPGTRPTSAPFTATDGTVRWLWINDPAIASKVGAYVETSVGSGAGSAWGFVNNYQMQSGSVSANAVRFGAEFDFTNASGTDCALGIACDALRIGIGGTNKSTTALDITSANGSSYAAIWGQRFSGAYLASESLIALDANSKYGIAANQLGLGGDTFTGALILDNAASPAAIKSTKTHSTAWLWDQSSSPVGILLNGTYANNQIQGTGFSVSPTGGVTAAGLATAGNATVALPASCISTAGSFATDGTSSWQPSCFGAFTAPTQAFTVYPTRGTTKDGNGNPTSNVVTGSLIQAQANGANPIQSNGQFINMDVVGGAQSGVAGSQFNATGQLISVRQRPDASGNKPPDAWGANIDLHVAPSSGNVQSYGLELDLNNFNKDAAAGSGAIAANLFLNGIAAYPGTSYLYAGGGNTQSFSGTVTTSGATVTLASGSNFTPAITRIAIAGATYRVNYVDATHLTITSTPPANNATAVAYSAKSAMVHDGILFSGPTNASDNDIHLNTAAYSAVTVDGSHNIGFNTSADSLTYAYLAKAGQLSCWNGFSNCLGYDTSKAGLSYNGGSLVLGDSGFITANGLASLNGGISVNSGSAGIAGSANKIALFGTLNGTAYGWGVSAGSLDAVAPGGASHTFYVGPAAPLKVTGAGITVTGLTMPGQYTVANLPTCNASTKGGMAVATDVSAAPTYRQTGLTGGGLIAVPVFCNGSAYEAH